MFGHFFWALLKNILWIVWKRQQVDTTEISVRAVLNVLNVVPVSTVRTATRRRRCWGPRTTRSSTSRRATPGQAAWWDRTHKYIHICLFALCAERRPVPSLGIPKNLMQGCCLVIEADLWPLHAVICVRYRVSHYSFLSPDSWTYFHLSYCTFFCNAKKEQKYVKEVERER